MIGACQSWTTFLCPLRKGTNEYLTVMVAICMALSCLDWWLALQAMAR
jgi:hypothetical protein